MDPTTRRSDGEEDDDDPAAGVKACETRPGRVVFTAEDNDDAWIATDLTVDVER